MTSRRQFIQTAPLVVSVLFASQQAFAADLDPKDPQAVALGYVPDATKVDKAKFPKYAAGQVCSNCALYQGKASDVSGPCPLFAGKPVAGKGWCSAYAKKA
jgi:hypothetical protein